MRKIVPTFLLVSACLTGNALDLPAKRLKEPVHRVQQNETLSGRVVDKNGNPIALATVSVKGTTKATTTNDDGFFVLTHSLDAQVVLTVSCVGYTTRDYTVQNAQDMRITLEDTQDLEEVVVVGYGTQRR